MLNSNKKWIIIFLFTFCLSLLACAIVIITIDPFFHYHKPINKLYYSINNQRSQNNGIIKHFEYDAIITGSSMTENFKSSECDSIFDVTSIKVPFFGGTYKEINDNLQVAFSYNDGINMVVRGLDMSMFIQNKDEMRLDMGDYPTYLYDKNPFNDVKYIFNKKILLSICVPMCISYKNGQEGGFTDFDHYSNWMEGSTFGKEAVLKNTSLFVEPKENIILTQEEKQTIYENISQNVISLAEAHPETLFYYFITPYSIAWWGEIYGNGELSKQIEAEEYVIGLILPYDNIRLFSFNNEYEVITNLDNYKDKMHYGEWINSMILKYMKEGKDMLTKDNYELYIQKEYNYFKMFDYNSLIE